jgi:hypothetical protein
LGNGRRHRHSEFAEERRVHGDTAGGARYRQADELARGL